MRKLALFLLVAALSVIASGCGGNEDKSGGATTAAASCDKGDLNLVSDGTLTVGTDNPAFPPWFGGDEKAPWKVSDPRSGEGFESAVAYAVADELGFSKDEVKWVVVPFNTSFAPGPKSFDFDINQISFKPVRAKAVDFSDSYYNVNQAIVVVKGTKIASAGSVDELKPYELGTQIGTTSYDYIVNNIKPSKNPSVFDTNDAAVQVPNSKILGQFPSAGAQEHFGLVFEKGNSLVQCVNDALSKLRTDGTLGRLQDKWLSKAAGAPVLK